MAQSLDDATACRIAEGLKDVELHDRVYTP
jgi:hypothetical protein